MGHSFTALSTGLGMQHAVMRDRRPVGQMGGREMARWGGAELQVQREGRTLGSRRKQMDPQLKALPTLRAQHTPPVLAAESHRGWQTGDNHTVGAHSGDAHTEAHFLTHNREPQPEAPTHSRGSHSSRGPGTQK